MPIALSGRQLAKGRSLLQATLASREAKKAAKAMSKAIIDVKNARNASGVLAFFTRAGKTKKACEKATKAFDDLAKEMELAANKAKEAFGEVDETVKILDMLRLGYIPGVREMKN